MNLVRIGIVLEVLLLLSTALWAILREIEVKFSLSPQVLIFGCILALPTLGLGKAIDSLSVGKSPFFSEFRRFKTDLIEPLCAAFSPASALLIALLSGAAEETFFRCIVFIEISRTAGPIAGFLGASLIFSILHFGTAVRHFPKIACIYFFFACYLQAAYLYCDDLAPPAVAHALHNFITILAVRRSSLRGLKHEAYSEHP